MQHELRRKDRSISQEEAWRILREGEYGVLSTVSADGQPYGVPLNYCVMDNAVYFHSALQGHKLDNMAANDRVCFCVVGNTYVLSDEFATVYESAMAFGRAEEAVDAEKRAALEALLDKYSQDSREQGLQYLEKMYGRAKVFRINVEALSGKARAA
jgi:hypothetical protein